MRLVVQISLFSKMWTTLMHALERGLDIDDQLVQRSRSLDSAYAAWFRRGGAIQPQCVSLSHLPPAWNWIFDMPIGSLIWRADHLEANISWRSQSHPIHPEFSRKNNMAKDENWYGYSGCWLIDSLGRKCMSFLILLFSQNWFVSFFSNSFLWFISLNLKVVVLVDDVMIGKNSWSAHSTNTIIVTLHQRISFYKISQKWISQKYSKQQRLLHHPHFRK